MNPESNNQPSQPNDNQPQPQPVQQPVAPPQIPEAGESGTLNNIPQTPQTPIISQQSPPGQKHHRAAFGAIVVIIILIVLAGGWFFFLRSSDSAKSSELASNVNAKSTIKPSAPATNNPKTKKLSLAARTKNSREALAHNISLAAASCESNWKANNKTAASLMPSNLLPIGASAIADGATVKVTKVIHSPKTTGDAPDPGTQYLEIDLAISDGQLPADYTIYTPSKPPGCFMEAVGVVDGSQKYFSPISNQLLPPKNVTIPDKISISSSAPITGSRYALFEIRPDDKGYLSLLDPMGKPINFALY